MKVSIITSCFNREATIGQAIESVLSQDYPDIEYIVVDGASKDGSLQVINRYKDRITRIISEPDKGMYEGINKGVQAATGDIIGLLHSDDFLFDRHVISDIVRKFSETGAELVYGNGLFVDFEHTDSWLPLHPTVYIRREVMGRWGLYNENYKIAADTDLLVRYLYEADLRVEYLNKYIVRMRMGGLSTDSARRKQMWKEDVGIYRAHGLNGLVREGKYQGYGKYGA